MSTAPDAEPADGSLPLTPLVRPDRFFAEREFHALRLLAILGLLVLAAPVGVYGVGWVLTANVDGAVLVDNPARPPDWFCGDDVTRTPARDGCEQPRQVERDVDAVIWSLVDRFVGPAMAGVLLVLGLVALLLHAGSWLAGGSGGVSSSFAVAAWGMVPELGGTLVGLGVLALWMDPVTVAPGTDPAAAIEPAMVQLRAVRPLLSAVTVATSAWSGVIWRYGLEHKRRIAGVEAWLVAGLVAGVLATFVLA